MADRPSGPRRQPHGLLAPPPGGRWWAEVRFTAPPWVAEAAAQRMMELGAAGVAVEEPAAPPAPESQEQGDKGPGEGSGACGLSSVVAHYPGPGTGGGLEAVQHRLELLQAWVEKLWQEGLALEGLSLSARWIPEEPWGEAWKRYFRPIPVGRRLVVAPSWEAYSPGPGERVLRLDPGMAFGTGGHMTTILCLEALEALARPGMRVMDVGTGSGILATVACLLGAERVAACDLDPVAVEAAQRNAASNGFSDRVRVVEGSVGSLAALGLGPADLVVANILAGVLVQLAPELAAQVRPGGWVIGSGVVLSAVDAVATAWEAAGLEVRGVQLRGEWACVAAQRPGLRGRLGHPGLDTWEHRALEPASASAELP